MEDGAVGVPSLTAVPPVEKGIEHRPDFATTHRLPMEEQIVLDQTKTQLLARIRNVVLVT
jgi:hypothetical protein